MSNWQDYNRKFNETTPREQYLIVATGVFLIGFLLFTLFIDEPYQKITKLEKQIVDSKRKIKNNDNTISMLSANLSGNNDPNKRINEKLLQAKRELEAANRELSKLSSGLIAPAMMKQALIDFLESQPGIKVIDFSISAPELIVDKKSTLSDKDNLLQFGDEKVGHLTLYRHTIQMSLQGGYFELRDYLKKLEALSWRFVWQSFNYTSRKYPEGQLDIKIYSLSTEREFIGV